MKSHHESHRVERIGWLRAAVLGANDGLISTSSLVMGVSAAHFADSTILMTGLAGLVGGALSMAAGEYVSVSSQADSEAADLARETPRAGRGAGSRAARTGGDLHAARPVARSWPSEWPPR